MLVRALWQWSENERYEAPLHHGRLALLVAVKAGRLKYRRFEAPFAHGLIPNNLSSS